MISPSDDRIKKVQYFVLSNYRAEVKDENGYLIPPFLTQSKENYQLPPKTTPFSHFIHYGDYDYFLFRFLTLFELFDYASYLGQQCIECYFKSFRVYKNQPASTSHDLGALREQCIKLGNHEYEFLESEYLEAIVTRFAPYNKEPRYPDHNAGVYSSKVMMTLDIYYLDYFIYEMRKIIILPELESDLLKDTNYFLYTFRLNHPRLYNWLKYDNINFELPPGTILELDGLDLRD